ncbi:hypothetical protein NYR54_18795 [Chelativorans sp. SCAU2101]|jgi:hypothetical protein|uniref:Uncharacterized protein n=1 Tax=Chelativorans petroleitrophicus TaxID=2975484 RepID=A0A9X2XCG4_9HYPH|nr:hypothetical protein [Chelativorans petroleitrophicus]MCT8992294.1 hypothetical protein [Chelativorans petroleitrophicus]
MSILDAIRPGARIKDLDGDGIAEIISVTRFGPDAVNLVYRAFGKVGERLLYRGDEARLEILQPGSNYTSGADGGLGEVGI